MADKKADKYRSRTHCLLLYPEDPTHAKALERLEHSYDYALCVHDQDVTEDGEIKKLHIHVVIRCPQAQWSSAICKDLGIPSNYIEEGRSFKNALLYLVHFNDPDKAQYSPESVKGPLKKRLFEEIAKDSKTESEKVSELLDYIRSYDGFLSVSDFTAYCANMGYWSEYRRAAFIFLRILDDHNKPFSVV